jgi:hypothetical protein
VTSALRKPTCMHPHARALPDGKDEPAWSWCTECGALGRRLKVGTDHRAVWRWILPGPFGETTLAAASVHRKNYRTLATSDVGRFHLSAFGRTWSVTALMGRILPQDVGKRVFHSCGILQVENDEQRTKRITLAKLTSHSVFPICAQCGVEANEEDESECYECGSVADTCNRCGALPHGEGSCG